MNEITKKSHSFFSGSLIFFIISIVLLLIVIDMKYSKYFIDFIAQSMETLLVNVDVPVVAGNITVTQGLAEFGGKSINTIEFKTYLVTFVSSVLLFVVIPLVPIYLRIQMKNNITTSIGKSVATKLGFMTSFGIGILMLAFIVGQSVVSYSILGKIKKDDSISEYRSNLQIEFFIIAEKAQQHFILPVEEGGGGNTFLKNNKPLTLKDLGFEEQTSFGRFILYQQKSDTVLYLHFIGNKKGTLTSGDNNPNITHVVEYKTIIYPTSHKVNVLN